MQKGFSTAKVQINNKFISANETPPSDNLIDVPNAPLVDQRPLAVRLAGKYLSGDF